MTSHVEDGLSVDADKVAVLFQGVLDDPRSWRGTGRWRIELAPVGRSASLHAYIATPKTADRLCAPYLTRGEVSCHNGNRVVLNAKRWLLGADSYGSDLTNYRRYLVNHEFGHALGKHHVDCPGSLAPVIMQQTKGLGHAGRTHGRSPVKIGLNRVGERHPRGVDWIQGASHGLGLPDPPGRSRSPPEQLDEWIEDARHVGRDVSPLAWSR